MCLVFYCVEELVFPLVYSFITNHSQFFFCSLPLGSFSSRDVIYYFDVYFHISCALRFWNIKKTAFDPCRDASATSDKWIS